MLNKKRYRITETSNEDKIDGRFGFTFKVKKCQVDKLHIFIYVNFIKLILFGLEYSVTENDLETSIEFIRDIIYLFFY